MWAYECKIVFKCDLINYLYVGHNTLEKLQQFIPDNSKNLSWWKAFWNNRRSTSHCTGEGCIIEDNNNSITISNNSTKGRTHGLLL